MGFIVVFRGGLLAGPLGFDVNDGDGYVTFIRRVSFFRLGASFFNVYNAFGQ